MTEYYQDNHIKLYNQDFRLNDLPDELVQMVCTSPPYWGLRKYSGEQELVWGDNHCEHTWGSTAMANRHSHTWATSSPEENRPPTEYVEVEKGQFCSLCGDWKGSYGLEPTPEMYVQHTIEILREIRRVLRKDGVVFWNIGDSYAQGGKHQTESEAQEAENKRVDRQKVRNDAAGVYALPSRKGSDRAARTAVNGLKPKDLCLIPFRVAIAAQEDGWWVRSVIIWSKNNPMPESVRDRPTESHEYIIMLTKSSRYYWDVDAVREPQSGNAHSRGTEKGNDDYQAARGSYKRFKSPVVDLPAGRNIRSVWQFPTQPYPEAHFAVYPEKLPEICIKAATPEVGCCSKCGMPWERIVERTGHINNREPAYVPNNTPTKTDSTGWAPMAMGTNNWQPTCKCNADKVPSVVLDPFAGAGTTLWVAKKLNRRAVGFEISEEYCQLTVKRIRQQVMV